MSDPFADAPRPTPPHVFDALDVVAAHLRSAGYVSAPVGATGGAIFYRRRPLAERQALLAEMQRLLAEIAELEARR